MTLPTTKSSPLRFLGVAILLGLAFSSGSANDIRFFHFPDTVPSVADDSLLVDNWTPIRSLDALDSLLPGWVLVRRRAGDDRASLWKARLQQEVFSRRRLHWYHIEPNLSVKSLLGKKAFLSSQRGEADDLRQLLFDGSRIYSEEPGPLCFQIDSQWKCLEQRQSLPYGSLLCTSTPRGAMVVLNGANSNFVTPCTIPKLFPGTYMVEVWLPRYRFARKVVQIATDSLSAASFSLVSDVDTVYITGTSGHGLLILPQAPLQTPFLLNGEPIHEQELTIPAGNHRLEWSKGRAYTKLDTTITIAPGKALYYFFSPVARMGRVEISSRPDSITLGINGRIIASPKGEITLPVGPYSFRARAEGYDDVDGFFSVGPDSLTVLTIQLPRILDRDGDGFPDSTDECPDRYGLLGGCPSIKTKTALRVKLREILDTLSNDQLGIALVPIGLIHRKATNRRFNSLLSLFDEGSHSLDNYRGLTLINQFSIFYKGLYGSVEFGQRLSGLEYKRDEITTLSTKRGDYQVRYDSLAGLVPSIHLPSTSVSIGIHFGVEWLGITYAMGRQWEDIELRSIISPSGEIVDISLDNDFWFHQLIAEVEYLIADVVSPSLYGMMKLPFGRRNITFWSSFCVGLQIRAYPKLRRTK